MAHHLEFKVAGAGEFDLDLEEDVTISELKKLASEECDILPEHMRFMVGDALLGNSSMASDVEGPIRVMYTAGHEAILGGGKPSSAKQTDPFHPPVRGIPGSKGLRLSRISARQGGILLKRQEFREKAEEIGFRKYR